MAVYLGPAESVHLKEIRGNQSPLVESCARRKDGELRLGISSSSWLYIQSGALQDIAFHLQRVRVPSPAPPFDLQGRRVCSR